MADNDQSRGEIAVLVKIFGGLREITGGELSRGTVTVRLSGEASVSDVIDAIAARAPMLAERIRSGSGYLNVLLNGRNVRFLDGMDTAVFDGAIVSILPPIGGG